MSLSKSLPLLVCSLAISGLAGASVNAADTDFIGSLPAWAKNADGLSQLSPSQITALNTAVQHDITLAEQGDAVAFSTSFSARRDAAQRASLGLDRLSFDQLNRLNDDVAHAIAYRPRLSTVSAGVTQTSHAAISGSLVDAGTIASFKRPWQTHGEVSLVVGGGKHSSFYGGSVEVTETDPSGNFTLGVGIGEIHSKGFQPCNAWAYGSGYGPYSYGGYPYGW